MILFFYGPNDYLLSQKLSELKKKYQEASKGSFDAVSLEGSDLTIEKFFAQTQTVALFATTRLVVINQLFDAPKEVLDKIKDFLPNISQSTVVVFIHKGEPDKRLGIFKALNKAKISQYFSAIDQSNLEEFIKKEAQNRNANLAAEEMRYLGQTVGANPWQLANEIEKLATYRGSEKITKQDIDELVQKNIFSNAFSLIDALMAKNNKIAIEEAEKLITTGEPSLKTLGAINFQIRLIALIKDELERGGNSYNLASRLKANPYPVKKSLPYASKFTWEDIDHFYSLLSELDEGVKTGKIKEEEALKELVLKNDRNLL
jgi:DNA polymerase-3 subunit delta